MQELLRSLMWGAIMACPDGRWESLDQELRTSVIMLFQPPRTWVPDRRRP